jgi:hypothetical protein
MIKECLIDQVMEQMGHPEQVSAEELGEVIDMIKDLEEVCYYHHKVKELEEKDTTM